LNQLTYSWVPGQLSVASNPDVIHFFVFSLLICSIFIIVLNYSAMQYDECIKDCDKAVERGRELRSDFKMIARALTRKGTALVKIAKTSEDYDIAIETFQKALTEHRNPDTLKKLNDAERAKKELEQEEYFDPKIADEEREKGVLI
jgi:tetratricopeptide (TPR) repeat protein